MNGTFNKKEERSDNFAASDFLIIDLFPFQEYQKLYPTLFDHISFQEVASELLSLEEEFSPSEETPYLSILSKLDEKRAPYDIPEIEDILSEMDMELNSYVGRFAKQQWFEYVSYRWLGKWSLIMARRERDDPE